jgi:CYTH domain-containing protein
MKIENEKKFLIDKELFFKNLKNFYVLNNFYNQNNSHNFEETFNRSNYKKNNLFHYLLFFLFSLIKYFLYFLLKIISIFSNKSFLVDKKYILQSYLFSDNNKNLRIRIENEKAILTYKEKISLEEKEIKSIEIERKIPRILGEKLIALSKNIIEKIRLIVIYKGNIFEVDFFYGLNDGLIIAEIEKKSFEKIKIPCWIKDDVTSDIRFFNSYLVSHPYKTWKK